MMNLREKLSKPRDFMSIRDYFQILLSTADALALINVPITEDELVINALNGVGDEYSGLATGIRARDNEISFEDLLDKMTNYEIFLKKREQTALDIIPIANYVAKSTSKNGNNKPQKYTNKSNSDSKRQRVVCQFCGKPGHSAKQCWKIKTINSNPRQTMPLLVVTKMTHHGFWILKLHIM